MFSLTQLGMVYGFQGAASSSCICFVCAYVCEDVISLWHIVNEIGLHESRHNVSVSGKQSRFSRLCKSGCIPFVVLCFIIIATLIHAFPYCFANNSSWCMCQFDSSKRSVQGKHEQLLRSATLDIRNNQQSVRTPIRALWLCIQQPSFGEMIVHSLYLFFRGRQDCQPFVSPSSASLALLSFLAMAQNWGLMSDCVIINRNTTQHLIIVALMWFTLGAGIYAKQSESSREGWWRVRQLLVWSSPRNCPSLIMNERRVCGCRLCRITKTLYCLHCAPTVWGSLVV